VVEEGRRQGEPRSNSDHHDGKNCLHIDIKSGLIVLGDGGEGELSQDYFAADEKWSYVKRNRGQKCHGWKPHLHKEETKEAMWGGSHITFGLFEGSTISKTETLSLNGMDNREGIRYGRYLKTIEDRERVLESKKG